MKSANPCFAHGIFYRVDLSESERAILHSALIQDGDKIARCLAENEFTVLAAARNGTLVWHLICDSNRQRYLYIELNNTWLIAPCEYTH